MRIGINALQIIPGKSTGDGTYVRNLVRFLPQVDEKNEYVLFLTEENRDMFPEETTMMRRVICPVSNRFKPLRALWEQTVFLRWIEREGIDLFHSTVNVSPLRLKCAVVLTIHDIEPYASPENISRGHLLYWRLTRGRSAARAKRVIAVSASLKNDIGRYMGVPAEKIVTVPHGVDHSLFNVTALDGDIADIPDRFILWAGSFYPGKNILRLLEAFKQLIDRGNKEIYLLLLRVPGWFDESEIMQKVKELNGRALIFDAVPHERLPAYYRKALFFVFPSLYETFGLPVLEAMACGAPVVASNRGALPEVIGDAGLLIDPYNVDNLSRAMERMLTDNRLREEMREKGIIRSRGYSWERTARETVKVYHEAYKLQRQN